ncbi:N-acetylmuramic acid 6-phosphate etherase [Agromyces sp. CFH 90414]|uniref:N-acetylmuramic acid 6-phosphate etherase n=1 Tax=Agromyces agglutinans TaxID=2662258 RepID=A0A6I2F5R7_9MICO|nr:N-acetylmuramic acid 6-phosphate etherase [Agromyces agglutinans]MRG60002.1 N-acetylmuramic acid 6-phosphate etherase [Agromyces agglutinans]
MPTPHQTIDRSSDDDQLSSPTEQRLEASTGLDALPSVEVLRLMNDQDRVAVDAVAAVLPQLADLVDLAAERFRRGGVVHYFGAGTSGRLGVLDAAELLPTFNLEAGRVVAHIAGGQAALVNAVEDAEDSEAEGRLAAARLGPDDVAIGLAASGNTPYVGGALAAAREAGAHTVLVSSNPRARVAEHADTDIVLDTGAEVLTGSTRLKAATAEKLVLNGFSTALMVAVGRTWSNLMVSVVATNEKLRHRTVRILRDAAGVDEATARTLLAEADGELKTAIVTALSAVSVGEARDLLAAHAGSVRDALAAASAP